MKQTAMIYVICNIYVRSCCTHFNFDLNYISMPLKSDCTIIKVIPIF